MLYPPEENATVSAAETERIGQGNLVPVFPRFIGDEIQTVERRIGDIIYRRQQKSPLHPLNSKRVFNCGSGSKGMADLGLVR
jgi:hypothetical protein